jgi:hypothetical protein
MRFMLLLFVMLAPALAAQQVTLGELFPQPGSTVPAGSEDANVFHFTLSRDGNNQFVPVFFTGLQLTNNGTAGPGDYTRLKLYQFTLGPNGLQQTLLATAESPALAFSGFARLLLPDIPDVFLVTAEIPLSSQHGATFELSLSSSQVTLVGGSVTGGPVTGGTQTISNTGFTPMIDLRDPLGNKLPSGLTATYDLKAAQGDTALSGQEYTFTIRNPGTGTLTLPGAPPVIALPISNCTVSVQQPPPEVAAGGEAVFRLMVEPDAEGAFSLGVSIFNNSGINPFLLTINGNAAVIAATQLAITTQPGSGRPGSPLSPQPVVEARVATGEVDSLFNGVVIAVIRDGNGGARIASGAAVKCVNGVAVFDNLAIDEAGTYTLEFVSGGLLSVVSASFEVKSASGGSKGDDGCAVQPGARAAVWAILIALPALIGMRRRLAARA